MRQRSVHVKIEDSGGGRDVRDRNAFAIDSRSRGSARKWDAHASGDLQRVSDQPGWAVVAARAVARGVKWRRGRKGVSKVSDHCTVVDSSIRGQGQHAGMVGSPELSKHHDLMRTRHRAEAQRWACSASRSRGIRHHACQRQRPHRQCGVGRSRDGGMRVQLELTGSWQPSCSRRLRRTSRCSCGLPAQTRQRRSHPLQPRAP